MIHFNKDPKIIAVRTDADSIRDSLLMKSYSPVEDITKLIKENDDPLSLFHEWLEEAKSHEPNDPSAACLATADQQGIPSARMILLKSFDSQGFVFYTNMESRKGSELAINPSAALCSTGNLYDAKCEWKVLLKKLPATLPMHILKPEPAPVKLARGLALSPGP